jgi:hypothetical protein
LLIVLVAVVSVYVSTSGADLLGLRGFAAGDASIIASVGPTETFSSSPGFASGLFSLTRMHEYRHWATELFAFVPAAGRSTFW